MAKKEKKSQVVKANPGTSEFNGGLLGYIGIELLVFVIIVFTLTLGTAWAVCVYQRWYAKHTKINGKQLVFDGKGIQLFGKYIAWFFLTVITVGIYGLWLPIKMAKWRMKHTYVEEKTANETAPAFPQGGFPAPVFPTQDQMQQYQAQCFYAYPQAQYMPQPQQPVQHCCPYSTRR